MRQEEVAGMETALTVLMKELLGAVQKLVVGALPRIYNEFVRFAASILGLATVVAIDSQSGGTPSTVVRDAARAVGVDLSRAINEVGIWLEAHPGVTPTAYGLAAIAALELVRRRPWEDIERGTVCATRAGAVLILSYAIAVESGQGVRLAPTFGIVALLVGGSMYLAASDESYHTRRQVLSLMGLEIVCTVLYAPVVALIIAHNVVFKPFRAYKPGPVRVR